MSDQAYLSGTDELAELKAAFMRYDADGSGYIRSALVEDALRCVGRDPARAMMILREFDPDGNGPVDFEQFIRIAATAQGVSVLQCKLRGGESIDRGCVHRLRQRRAHI